MDQVLAQILNVLLESERAGVAALDSLLKEVTPDELRKLLRTSREDEAGTVSLLEALIRFGGDTPSDKVARSRPKWRQRARSRMGSTC